MNAEYQHSGKAVQFDVTPVAGDPPTTAKITERSTCGKWILERMLVLDYYDQVREVAIYSLIGTGRRPV